MRLDDGRARVVGKGGVFGNAP
jgi:hypothetical protein